MSLSVVGNGALDVAGAAAFTALLVQQTKFLVEYVAKPTNPNHDAFIRIYVDVVAMAVVIAAEWTSGILNINNGQDWLTALVQGFSVALAAISGYHLLNGLQPQTQPSTSSVPAAGAAPQIMPGSSVAAPAETTNGASLAANIAATNGPNPSVPTTPPTPTGLAVGMGGAPSSGGSAGAAGEAVAEGLSLLASTIATAVGAPATSPAAAPAPTPALHLAPAQSPEQTVPLSEPMTVPPAALPAAGRDAVNAPLTDQSSMLHDDAGPAPVAATASAVLPSSQQATAPAQEQAAPAILAVTPPLGNGTARPASRALSDPQPAFHPMPELQFSPQSGAPGSVITLRGSDFRGQSVRVEFRHATPPLVGRAWPMRVQSVSTNEIVGTVPPELLQLPNPVYVIQVTTDSGAATSKALFTATVAT